MHSGDLKWKRKCRNCGILVNFEFLYHILLALVIYLKEVSTLKINPIKMELKNYFLSGIQSYCKLIFRV